MKKYFLYFMLLVTSTAYAQKVTLKRLENNTIPYRYGISWGVPFTEGSVRKTQQFVLKNQSEKPLDIQQWPMAYWPDGSIKWMGFATTADSSDQSFSLSPAKAISKVQHGLNLTETYSQIILNSGNNSYFFSKRGPFALDSVVVNQKTILTGLGLEAILQDQPDDVLAQVNKEKLACEIIRTELEQSGEVRSVVKISGVLKAGERQVLHFILRFYLYAHTDQIRVVQTVIYDGEPERDFIKGLALSLKVPMREQTLNHHIRFSGEENGIWAEPVQPVNGRRNLMYDNRNVFEDQVRGLRIPDKEKYDAKGQTLIKDWAVWNDFLLTQHTSDGFRIQKRTHKNGAWIDANSGGRARGLTFTGDVSGGVSLGLKDFWQSYPAALEVTGAGSREATLRAWMWSPYAEVMDMRHYDTLAYGHGLEASYEDIQPGFSTANGVARTSEITLFLHESVPSNAVLSQLADHVQQNNLLVSTPEYLHKTGVFGVWSLPDTSSAGKKWLENQLTAGLDFYKNEIDDRRWYGYWNYGDVMHSYDPLRHEWKYDVGGFAWANTELVPDMWLWYSYLRTGRKDIFKMASAMTRHTSEVDVYHLGKFQGLGSRHNVRHWGCGAKEVRISQAALKRFFYYLTTDERTGELIRETIDADEALVKTDPLRLILPKSAYPTHARMGPDWLALVGNWMTEWERTGGAKWKDKILAGVNSFSKMPYGFFSGKDGAFGYDPKDATLHQLAENEIGAASLATIMGGGEVAFELSKILKNKDFDKLWLQYCRLYGAPKETISAELGREAKLGDMSPHYTRLMAYDAKTTGSKEKAAKAWEILLNVRNHPWYHVFETTKVPTPDVLRETTEIKGISTNNTAQWSLNAIQLLELIGDRMPEQHDLWKK